MDGSLFFSVGEPSGDLHASNLIHGLKNLAGDFGLNRLETRGLGGSKMASAGCQIDYDLTQLAVVGMLEVLPKLREFFRVADLAEAILKRERPRAVVLVDFPGFNWHIARRAHQLGIPVIYYLPPQLWAWGAWRLKKMRRTVDHVLCNLPFEPQWYAARNVDVQYVGHPFFDEVASKPLDKRFLDEWGQYEGLQVAVLPGSRSREVENIWPIQLAAIRELASRYPRTRFLVGAYRDSQCQSCRRRMSTADQQLNIEFFVGKTSEIIELADCALMKSGSVSLEMMARGTPAVVTYHASRTLYAIGRCLTNLNSMTLPNMIAGETVMPEFLAVGSSSKATEQVISAMDRLLGDADARDAQAQKLRALSAQYAQPGASLKAARSILQIISGSLASQP
ncbi:MAG: lipid-A-disaccharide synthase [Pirellulaceae bacterium]|nr:lipid-A-disaccharide synthase [Pirellulaceae bacterium]